jgi:hypothetical protein
MKNGRSAQRLWLPVFAVGLSLTGSCGDDDDDDISAAVRKKLQQCMLISGGELVVGEPEDSEERCFSRCFLEAGCADVKTIYCSNDDEEAVFSEAFQECARDCLDLETVECELAEVAGFEIDAAYKCNGFPECQDGSDEQGCPEPELFMCDDGESVLADYKCDREEDCEDGSDEKGCPDYPEFTCENGDTVPAEYECDLEVDCEDGSDEHDACAQLMCE